MRRLIGVLAVALVLVTVRGVRAEAPEPVEFLRGDTTKPQVALTFDCGPWVDRNYVTAILDALEQYGLRVTFFVTGQFIEAHPDIFAERIVPRHEVGNHSYSHPDFPKSSSATIRQEFRWTEELIAKYGASSHGMWRAPFGARTRRELDIAADEGYPTHIMWTTDSGDWLPISAERVRATVLNRAENGSIFVEHCNSWQSATVLSDILWQLREWGMNVVPVSEIIAPSS
jgi:peptidoglycan/xylan/chitin deacetylase (PgdA/CDA1 family)